MASQLASAMQQPAGRGLHSESSELHSYSYSDPSAAALPFAQLLANAASGGSDWKVLLICHHTNNLGGSCHIPVLAMHMSRPACCSRHSKISNAILFRQRTAGRTEIPLPARPGSLAVLCHAEMWAPWVQVRVEGFESLTAVLSSPSAAAHVAAHLDRLVALFIENIGKRSFSPIASL